LGIYFFDFYLFIIYFLDKYEKVHQHHPSLVDERLDGCGRRADERTEKEEEPPPNPSSSSSVFFGLLLLPACFGWMEERRSMWLVRKTTNDEGPEVRREKSKNRTE
jgi:hypothetical protein